MTDADAPNIPAGERSLAVLACYDGSWWRNVVRFIQYAHPGKQINFAGYQDALRWHVARLSRVPVDQVAITEAHYVTGNTQSVPWGDELASLGIVRHDVPVTIRKGEIGAGVEIALTCLQTVYEKRADVVALMSGDSHLGPLAARLTGLGIVTVVPVTNFHYPNGRGEVNCKTSNLLLRHATSAPRLIDLIDTGQSPSYPAGLRRPLMSAQPSNRRSGTVTVWYPNGGYGFIMADDGQTWYGNEHDVRDGACVQEGWAVTFVGSVTAIEGKIYPRARDIQVGPDSQQSMASIGARFTPR